ncbi:hypothetical protein C8R46DRAFT_980239 [Mycena filopes]|nr:hypothetical protein C8R46DRAFT_980239 [Mycena filopes]
MQRGFFDKRRGRSTKTKSQAKGASRKRSTDDVSAAAKDTESSTSTRKIIDQRQDTQFHFSDVCRLYSNSPRIIVADYRHPAPSSHFLFLPSAQNATMVFIDSLESVQAVSAWPLWNEPAPSPTADSDPPFVIRAADGDKGLGMFATRPIPRGARIVAERPTLVSHPRLSVHPDQTHAFYESALAGLGPSAQAALAALRNAHAETPASGRVRGILLTNALGAQLPLPHDATQTRYSALFAQLCRANHACAPNAHYVFAETTFMGRLTALRAIDAGEEVTIGYTDLAAPRAERRRRLAEKYRFECGCAVCGLAPARAIVSDTRRAAIGAYFVQMREAKESGERAPVGAPLGRVKQLIGAAEQEGLVEAACMLAISAMRLAQREGDQSEQLRLTIQAMNYIRALEGNDSASFVTFAGRMGLGAEELATMFDDMGEEIDYGVFRRLLAANSKSKE